MKNGEYAFKTKEIACTLIHITCSLYAYLCMYSYHLHILIYLAFDNHAYFTSDPAFTSVHMYESVEVQSSVSVHHLFGGHLFDVFMVDRVFIFYLYIYIFLV